MFSRAQNAIPLLCMPVENRSTVSTTPTTALIRSLEAWKDPSQAISSKERAKLDAFICERVRREKQNILRAWQEVSAKIAKSRSFYRLVQFFNP